MIWIVSPMLHDTESYVRLRDEVLASLAGHDADVSSASGTVRFLVVDDSAGTDGQVATLAAFPDVQVLTPPFNLGHQRAIVYGLRHLLPALADDSHGQQLVAAATRAARRGALGAHGEADG